MILGFISLLLVFSQYYITQICVPSGVADSMLPCRARDKVATKNDGHRRRLIGYERRVLAAGAKEPSCKQVIHVPCSFDKGETGLSCKTR